MSPEAAAPDPVRPLAVVDIDGVVADVRHRLHHVEGARRDWPAFFAGAADDLPLAEGLAVVDRLVPDHDLVWLSGRPERLRPVTLAWFAAHGLPAGREMILRGDADRRPARVVKVAALRRLAQLAPVAVVVDDDPDVCDAVGSAGFPVLLADWVPRPASLGRAQRGGRT